MESSSSSNTDTRMSANLLDFCALRYKVQKSAVAVGNKEFIPADNIGALLTRQSIKDTLEDAGVDPDDKLTEFVLQKARKVFLILVYLEDLTALSGLHACGFDDRSLPVETRTPDEKIRRGRSRWEVASLNETTHNFDNNRLWPVFETWRTPNILAFEAHQWKFLAATFSEAKFYYTFPKECPLPFLPPEDGDKDPRTGHYSNVYKLGLYRQNFQEQVGHLRKAMVMFQCLHNLNEG